ncbi:hypothetical protein ACNKHO_19625 [Shigella flexneri]
MSSPTYEAALKAISFELETRDLIDSVALIGHRIAHGGNIFTPVRAEFADEVIDRYSTGFAAGTAA